LGATSQTADSNATPLVKQPTSSALTTLTPAESRARVLNELLTTERDYVADLEVMWTLFVQPLSDGEIIDERDHGEQCTTRGCATFVIRVARMSQRGCLPTLSSCVLSMRDCWRRWIMLVVSRMSALCS
jgi:hypothetical protein